MQWLPRFSQVLQGDLVHNFPLISLIFANLVTMVLAVLGNWDLATVLFVYWMQSIIIGVFTVFALLTAGTATENYSNDGTNGEKGLLPVIQRIGNAVARLGMTGFFIVHYGIFHYAYYTLIVEAGIFGQVNFSDPGIYISCGLFAINHFYSFIDHWKEHIRGDGEDDFFEPYRRIIPMHLTIIIGSIVIVALQENGISSTMPVLVFFLALKMLSDISAHVAKHSRKNSPGVNPS
jgi:hypothetical protein